MRISTLHASSLIVGSLLGSVSVWAQDAEPAEGQGSPPPKINIAVPPAPAPAIERKFHVHTGFYAALQAGPGIMGTDFDNGDPASNSDISGSGFNLSFDLLMGHSLSPGFALGGGIFNDFLLSAEFERDGQSFGDQNARTTVVGLFADGFPQAKGGWRLGGSAGLAQINGNGLATDGDAINQLGLGFAGWVGYTPWVGDEFSTGVTLRALAAIDPGGDVTANTRSLSLMWSGIYF